MTQVIVMQSYSSYLMINTPVLLIILFSLATIVPVILVADLMFGKKKYFQHFVIFWVISSVVF